MRGKGMKRRERVTNAHDAAGARRPPGREERNTVRSNEKPSRFGGGPSPEGLAQETSGGPAAHGTPRPPGTGQPEGAASTAPVCPGESTGEARLGDPPGSSPPPQVRTGTPAPLRQRARTRPRRSRRLPTRRHPGCRLRTRNRASGTAGAPCRATSSTTREGRPVPRPLTTAPSATGRLRDSGGGRHAVGPERADASPAAAGVPACRTGGRGDRETMGVAPAQP